MSASNPCRIRSAMRCAALATLLLPLAALAGDGKPNNHKPRDLSKGNTMFVVPYAHLDTQWRWAYPQVIREFIANTLNRNFDLIEKYPNYVFNFSGSRRYEMMKQYYPAEYQRLKDYIKAGRWFPCGSSVDENDANVPSAESLIRQVLYGNHYFRKEFGVASDEYMLPDCFGFPYALPSILSHCGIKGFSTQKLTWGSAVGIPFKVGTWEGPDGKSIVAALDPGGYGARVDEDLSQNTSWLARIQNTGTQSGAFVDYHYYGTGDTGGAPTAGSVDWVEKSIAGSGPITVVSSHADEMFKSLTPTQIAKLPHYKGELLLVNHSAGSISSQAMMKRWNRKNELLAQGAEEAAVAASWLGKTYPSKRIYDAWDLVLGSQMHDMLPGTSIPKAYEFCWNDELLASNQFAAVETDAVGAIASAMDTRSRHRETHRYGPLCLVVYNPLSVARTDVVEARIPDYTEPLLPVQVLGPDGKPVPTQTLGADWQGTDILFKANVPACGFAVFEVRRSGGADLLNSNKAASSIENGALRVRIDKNGDIASIYDKVHKREVLKAPVRLAFQYENPRQYPAWNMDWEDQQKPPYGYLAGPAKVTLVESGPVRQTLRVERQAFGSKFVQDIRLANGSDQVEVLNHIDWQTKQTALKATFPLANGNPNATYDLQVGAIERGNNSEKHFEVPQHQWFDVTRPDKTYGTAILNDSKFASDKPDDNTVRLTLIYTPGTRAGYADQGTQDIGRHEILFAIAPHAGNWAKAEVPWKAKRLNQPLRAFIVSPHAGSLGRSFSLLKSSTSQVEIQAIKKAEDSDSVIIRLRELTGQPAHVTLKAAAPIKFAAVVDGQERRIDKARVTNGTVTTDVGAFSLKALELKLDMPHGVYTERSASAAVKLAYDTDVVSTFAKPADGNFDGQGNALAADLLPKTLTVGGVAFNLGPTSDGSKNAATSAGQTLSLPAGYSRVYLLAASSKGDVDARFKVGNRSVSATVQDWSGFVGQWDNRLWAGDPGPNFTNYGEMVGLVPGYVKSGEVAWFANHSRSASGNAFYRYTYLYKIGLDIPKGAKALVLPRDPRIKVLAVSVSNAAILAEPAASLYDRLADHRRGTGPTAELTAPRPNDGIRVTLNPPLYWSKGSLWYTTGDPAGEWFRYAGPMTFHDPAKLYFREVSAGSPSPITSVNVSAKDTTPPRVEEAASPKALALVRVRFSEALDTAVAKDPMNYRFSSGASVTGVRTNFEGNEVELTLDKPLPAGQTETITVSGVKDRARIGNVLTSQALTVEERGAVFDAGPLEPKATKSFRSLDKLPTKAHDAWTINLWCKIDEKPADRVIIGGFGRSVDGRTGTGRYFANFPNGINFWSANKDVMTREPLDIGKWQMLTATYDGYELRIYKNGRKIAEKEVELSDDQAQAMAMPLDAWERQRRFNGEVRDFTIWDMDLPEAAIQRLWRAAG